VTKTNELKQRFQREVEAAARLTHPNIVRAFDAGEGGGSPFLVMEYVPGDDLASIVKKRGPLSVDQAIDCIAQAARGLEFAHSRGVIHRDIKPANLLMDTKGTVKILDMGLARIDATDVATQAELTGSGAVMGTVDYMAPEQALSTKQADARSDLYSLGISLWYLLVGKSAYEGDSLMSRMLAHREQPIPSLRAVRDDVPESLDSIFRKLVAKKPSDRYPTATQLMSDLEACRAGANLEVETVVATGADEAETFIQGIASPAAADPDARSRPGKTGTLDDFQSPNKSTDETIVSAYAIETHRLRRQRVRKPDSIIWYQDRRAQIGGGVAAIMLLFAFVYLVLPSPRTKQNATGDPTIRKDLLTISTPADTPVPSASQDPTSDGPRPAIAPFDANQARLHQEAWARYLGVPVEYTNSIGMKFRLIPPGEFTMGVTVAEIEEMIKVLLGDAYVSGDVFAREAIRSGAPRHKVKLTQPFFLGLHEVTQEQYKSIAGRNPACFSANGRRDDLSVRVKGVDTGNHPVEDVSWEDAVEFCDALSESEGFNPFGRSAGDQVDLTEACYRLPTEAEWEFACRAGTTTKFWTGDLPDDLTAAAFSGTTAFGRTHPVGELKPNPFGLFDIHGQVSEFVEDRWDQLFYEKFASEPAIDPYLPPMPGCRFVVRGSNWYFIAPMCNSGARLAHEPTVRLESVGFRVVMTVSAVKAAISEPFVTENPETGYSLTFADGGGVLVPSLRRDDAGPFTVEMRLKLRRPRLGVVFCIDGQAACQVQPGLEPEMLVGMERLVLGGEPVRAPFPANNRWHHIAYVLGTSEAVMFIDGRAIARVPRLLTASAESAPEANAGTAIGTQRYGGNRTYHTIAGSIDELRVSRIARYENDFVPEDRFTSDADTVALYHCDEGDGNVLVDSSGNEHHGEVINTRWTKDSGRRRTAGEISNQPH
jgi:formylglycine-generating enzyme required for sulfatase activity